MHSLMMHFHQIALFLLKYLCSKTGFTFCYLIQWNFSWFMFLLNCIFMYLIFFLCKLFRSEILCLFLCNVTWHPGSFYCGKVVVGLLLYCIIVSPLLYCTSMITISVCCSMVLSLFYASSVIYCVKNLWFLYHFRIVKASLCSLLCFCLCTCK